MGSGSGPRIGGEPGARSRAQDAAAAHGAEHQIASKSSAAGGEGPMMMMASATNKKSDVDPLTFVEKVGQLEKAAAALCVGEKPVDAIAEAGDKATAAGEAGDKAPATREGLTALPKEEVERVLSWKRGKLTSDFATEDIVEVFETLCDSFAEYQAWMRAEYEANDGVVWVDDEFLREDAESRQSLRDYWKEEKLGEDDFDFTGWHFDDDVDSPGWNIP